MSGAARGRWTRTRYVTRRVRRSVDDHRPHRRRLRVVGIGLPKTGTTSLAESFGRPYRSRHDAHREHCVVATRAVRGTVDPAEVRAMLDQRDRLRLDVDATTFLTMFAADIAEHWPDARLVLTVRDCFSWLRSFAAQQAAVTNRREPWASWVAARIPVGANDAEPGDTPLLASGGLPVRSQLRAWAETQHRVLHTVPGERLLVIRTDELSESRDRLVAFTGAGASTVQPVHRYRGTNRPNALAGIDPDHVLRVAEDECAPLMEQHWGMGWRDLITGLES